MSPAKFIILVLFLYIVSLLASVILENQMDIFSWAGLFVLSIIFFSILFVICVVVLAIIYAVVKKPIIETGTYRLDRIKGKRE
jgi:predicted membrane protein